VDKKMPKIIESKEIQKIVAYDNIPFASASKIFCGQKQNCPTKAPFRKLSNFAMLT
jgi:hypothetical protein